MGLGEESYDKEITRGKQVAPKNYERKSLPWKEKEVGRGSQLRGGQGQVPLYDFLAEVSCLGGSVYGLKGGGVSCLELSDWNGACDSKKRGRL